MRTEKSIKNSAIAAIAQMLAILVGFIAQRVFIKILGAEYLGVNGLFTNILSILNIAELGIGEAIIFNMYKPIAEDNKKQIKSLMLFYKKAYNIIAMLILVIGLCLIPFLDSLVEETSVNLNLTGVYVLFLLQTVASYILTYKRSILYASQKNYIINLIHIAYLIIMNISQLSVLYITRNYYLYLIIKIICVILENIVINIYANKKFSYINDKKIEKLDKKTEKDIFKRIKAQFFHKIGSAIVNSTDNILISKFFGVITVGLYSNYYLVINSVKNLFSQFISAITASVGNLLVEDDSKKSFEVYKKVRFFNFWIATFSGISILVIMQNFVKIWVGEEYLLDQIVLYVLVFNYYQKQMRTTNDTFMSAAGICVENRFVPLIEAILNIVFSIVLLKIFGLVGVFLGTIVSGFALWGYNYPKFLYKKIFKRTYLQYAKETIGYILLFIAIAIVTYLISNIVVIKNILLQIVIEGIICLVIPNLILFIIFRKTDNFEYFKRIMGEILNKVKLKIQRA